MKITLTLILLSAFTAAAIEIIPLWPEGEMPGETGTFGEEADQTKETENLVGGKRLIRLGNVTKPTLSVYPAPADKATGTSVLICPGGGYNILAWDLEGTEVADWLNSVGVTAYVLKYRVPRRPDQDFWLPPLMDAQRAMSIIRARSTDKIGVLGFSAGGHLAFRTATSHRTRRYEAIDDTDKASTRPDFAVLVYPAYLTEKDGLELLPDFPVDKDTPPSIFIHASDDGIPVQGSIAAYLALKKAGVPSELHAFSAGGHGYGLRPTEMPVTRWPDPVGAWMKFHKFIN
jgi:acetyl esterase/lipase